MLLLLDVMLVLLSDVASEAVSSTRGEKASLGVASSRCGVAVGDMVGRRVDTLLGELLSE